MTHYLRVTAERTLVVFPGALGDFLCLWPALESLRGEVAAVTLVARAEVSDLLGPGAYEFVSIEARAVTDLFASGPLDARTRAIFGGHARIHTFAGASDEGFAARLSAVTGGRVAVHRVRGMAAGEHASLYFARCLGVRPRPCSLAPNPAATQWADDLWATTPLDGQTLAVHDGSGSGRKNWQGMDAIARRWRRDGGRVLLLAGPAEDDAATLLPHDVLLRGERLSRVAAALRRAERYLGNDSGISHLAGLVGVRGAVAFGPSDPDVWRPNGDGIDVVRASRTCGRCGAEVFCTHRLSVERVWAALVAAPGRRDQNSATSP